MVTKGWKNVAIVFIITTILLSLFLMWSFALGVEMINNENECAFDICEYDETYYYDDNYEVCYCYNSNDVLVKQEYMN